MISLIKGNITDIDTDIIVTSANRFLISGGEVNTAIHRKAGVGLIDECKKIGGCKAGDAVMTDAYNLNAKKVIHAVGPIYINGKCDEDKILKKTYISVIELADKYRKDNNLDHITITVPCISTGTYKYPKNKAALIAVETVSKLLKKHDRIDVIFVCLDEENYVYYKPLVS